METNQTDERARFVRDFESGHWSMTELCERYGVSRPTGYKWMARRTGGGDFADRRHAPQQANSGSPVGMSR
jgi:transposase